MYGSAADRVLPIVSVFGHCSCYSASQLQSRVLRSAVRWGLAGWVCHFTVFQNRATGVSKLEAWGYKNSLSFSDRYLLSVPWVLLSLQPWFLWGRWSYINDVCSFLRKNAAMLARTEPCYHLFQCGTSLHFNWASGAVALFYEWLLMHFVAFLQLPLTGLSVVKLCSEQAVCIWSKLVVWFV